MSRFRPSHTVSPRLRGRSKRFISRHFSLLFRLGASHDSPTRRSSPAGHFAGNFDPVLNRDSNLGFEAMFTQMDGPTASKDRRHAPDRCTGPAGAASGESLQAPG